MPPSSLQTPLPASHISVPTGASPAARGMGQLPQAPVAQLWEQTLDG